MTTIDYLPGDPANHVLGKPEEKPAKRHAKQKPKPTKTARGIAADIKLRMQEIEPLVKEYEILKEVDAALNAPPPKAKVK
jgi:hypothetical protein